MLVYYFISTWSLKSAAEAVSKRFNVSKETLRVDWHRRNKWLKEVLDHVSSPILSEFYLMGIHRTLQQIEEELTQNTNPNCRVGLLKTKAEILFKLIEIQKSIEYQEVLMKRIENMEKKLQSSESKNQKDRVKKDEKIQGSRKKARRSRKKNR